MNKEKLEAIKDYYREHLELLCDHSKKQYCIGCGMTLQFFDSLLSQSYQQGRIEVLEEVRTFINDLDYEDLQTKSINTWVDEFINTLKLNQ